MDIKFSVSNILKQIEDLKNSIADNINQMPDNPKIKRLSTNPHCFIVNSKDLEDNLSAEYYDTKYQAKMIIEIIKSRENLNSIKNMLDEIANTGIYKVNDGHRMFFNTQVREYIKNIL